MTAMSTASICPLWQKIKQLLGEIYVLRSETPVKAHAELAASLRRTSVSIASAVANTHCAPPSADRTSRLRSADDSLQQLRAYVFLAQSIYGAGENAHDCLNTVSKIRKMLRASISMEVMDHA